MTTVKLYLESQGRKYPRPDNEDGSISQVAFEAYGVPMVVACTHCRMTMVCSADRLIDERTGCIYCDECAPMPDEVTAAACEAAFDPVRPSAEEEEYWQQEENRKD